MASREEVEMMGVDLGRGKGERGREGEFGDDLMTKSGFGSPQPPPVTRAVFFFFLFPFFLFLLLSRRGF